MRIYNPLSWFRSEPGAELAQARLERQMDVVMAEARDDAQRKTGAPKPPDHVTHCPECNWQGIAKVPGGQLRCSQCGHQWWPAGASKPNPNPYTRGDLFGMGNGRFPR